MTGTARLTEADRDIIAEARRLAPALKAGNGDRDRLAGWLLYELDGIIARLDGQDAEALIVPFCKGCRRATRSALCPRCGGPESACAACGRCPDCDGD